MLTSPSIRRAPAALAVLAMLTASLMSCDRAEDTGQDPPDSKAADSSPQAAESPTQQDRLWDIVRQIDSVAAYEAYLESFPGDSNGEGSSLDEDASAKRTDDEKPYAALARARVAELQEEAQHADEWGMPDELPEYLPSVESVAAVLALPDGQERDEKVKALLGHGPAIVVRLAQVVDADEAGMGDSAARLLAETGRTGRKMLNRLLLGKDEEVANRAAIVLPLLAQEDYDAVLSTRRPHYVMYSDRIGWFLEEDVVHPTLVERLDERRGRWRETMAPTDAALEKSFSQLSYRPLDVTSVLRRLRLSDDMRRDDLFLVAATTRCSPEQIEDLVQVAANPNEYPHVRQFALECLCEHAPSKTEAARVLADAVISGEFQPTDVLYARLYDDVADIISPKLHDALAGSGDLEALALVIRASAFGDPRELLPNGDSYLEIALQSPSPSARLWAARWLLRDSHTSRAAIEVLVDLIDRLPGHVGSFDIGGSSLGYGWLAKGRPSMRHRYRSFAHDFDNHIHAVRILSRLSDRLGEMDLPHPLREKAEAIPRLYWWAKDLDQDTRRSHSQVFTALLDRRGVPTIDHTETTTWHQVNGLRSQLEAMVELLSEGTIREQLQDRDEIRLDGLLGLLADGKSSSEEDVRFASVQLARELATLHAYDPESDTIKAIRSTALLALAELLSNEAMAVRVRAIEVTREVLDRYGDDEGATEDVDRLRRLLQDYQPLGWEDRITVLRSSGNTQWLPNSQMLAELREVPLLPSGRRELQQLMLDGSRSSGFRAAAAAIWAMDGHAGGEPDVDIELSLPDPLREALDSGDPWLRAVAADTCRKFVAEFGDASSRSFVKTFHGHPDSHVRFMALWAFNDGEITAEEIEGLIAATRDKRAWVRRTAVLVMTPNHIARSPECENSLLQLGQDADWTVRLQALHSQLNGLPELMDSDEQAAALEALLSDSHPFVRANGVVYARACTTEAQYADILAAALQDDYWVVRLNALHEVCRLAEHQALSSKICDALADMLIQGECEPEWGLAALGMNAGVNEEAVTALVRVLETPKVQRQLMSVPLVHHTPVEILLRSYFIELFDRWCV